jgi:hypothetical protein
MERLTPREAGTALFVRTILVGILTGVLSWIVADITLSPGSGTLVFAVYSLIVSLAVGYWWYGKLFYYVDVLIKNANDPKSQHDISLHTRDLDILRRAYRQSREVTDENESDSKISVSDSNFKEYVKDILNDNINSSDINVDTSDIRDYHESQYGTIRSLLLTEDERESLKELDFEPVSSKQDSYSNDETAQRVAYKLTQFCREVEE